MSGLVVEIAENHSETGSCPMRFGVLALLSILLLGGCSLPSWSKPSSKSTPKSDAAAAEALLKQGTDYLDKKKYSNAIIQFERIREEHPFSAQAVEVELKIAEAYYRSKKYSEAEAAYKDFLAFRPTNKEVPFVIYRLGLVHFDQFTTIDRDQKNIETAKGYFETLIKEHPKSPYVADSMKKLTKCRLYLAEREFYVGTFYLKEKKYSAAKERFETVVRHYLDTPVGIRALFHLGESYRLEKNSIKAALAYEALIKHYPKSPLSKNAQIQLAQLDKVQHDPLAQLLIRDGRPVFASSPENGQRTASSGAFQNPNSAIQNRTSLNMATKKEVTFEEGTVNGNGEKKKGFFRRMVGAINPFSSSSEEKENGNKKTDNGTEVAKANNNIGVGELTKEIDASLKEKGIDAEEKKLASRPPAPDLPEINEEPTVPPKTKEVLGKVDEGLNKEGKNVAELPPPPKLTVTRRTKTKAKDQKTQPTLSSSGMLGAIDKKLMKEGIELPKEGEASTTGGLQASKPTSQPAFQPTVELSPRLSKETSPFLINPGEFQLEEKPAKGEKVKNPESLETAGPATAQGTQPLMELPASFTKSPPPILPEKKEESAGKKTADGGPEGDGAKDAFGAVKDEIGKFKRLLESYEF